MVRPPPDSKVSELTLVAVIVVAAAPTVRAPVKRKFLAAVNVVVVSVAAINGRKPLASVASYVPNWTAAPVPLPVALGSITSQGMIRKAVSPFVAVAEPTNVVCSVVETKEVLVEPGAATAVSVALRPRCVPRSRAVPEPVARFRRVAEEPLSCRPAPAPTKVKRLNPLLIWTVPVPIASLTATEALPLRTNEPPCSRIDLLAEEPPARTEEADAVLSKVSELSGTMPEKPDELTVVSPPVPVVPAAPETTTEPAEIVRPFCVFAAVRLSEFEPTLVSRKAPEMAPESVRSPPAVPPVTELR